ncbi:hypothetical protein HanIR_Chr03g0149551 [Helianthus annuus]|nr:hypothetical protein HanIR_Chr03g0149551 [Helianthus annuus]
MIASYVSCTTCAKYILLGDVASIRTTSSCVGILMCNCTEDVFPLDHSRRSL